VLFFYHGGEREKAPERAKFFRLAALTPANVDDFRDPKDLRPATVRLAGRFFCPRRV
jgi:hypothetical protein